MPKVRKPQSQLTVAIIGAGPSGCALSCLLVRRGIQCIVFDHNIQPDLLVGESLLPATIPLFQQLGIEEAVAQISQRKPGVTLKHTNGLEIDFTFRAFRHKAPAYAYNIPRPEFDQLLRRHAEASGVQFVQEKAHVIQQPKSDFQSSLVGFESSQKIVLSPESINAGKLTHPPDILVDATGRHRLFSRKLSLPNSTGKRQDVAYFAHFKKVELKDTAKGQVIISILKAGWAWQIPLKETVSMGVVLDKKAAKSYGETAEQRLETIINDNPVLQTTSSNRERVSQVKTYSNYQIKSQQTFGNGWVLMGDALGFSDPMLSSGIFMALKSAEQLDKALNRYFKVESEDDPNAALKQSRILSRYAKGMHHWLSSWDELIDYFYNGQLLSLYQAGDQITQDSPTLSIGRFMRWHLQRALASSVAGVGTGSMYQKQLLKQSCQHLLKNLENPEENLASNRITSFQ